MGAVFLLCNAQTHFLGAAAYGLVVVGLQTPSLLLDISEQARSEAERPLPQLREDLGIFPSTRTSIGEKSWVLHDPVRNRYFHIGEPEFLMLSLWGTDPELDRLQAQAQAEGASISRDDVLAFSDFLLRCDLCILPKGTVERFSAMHKAKQHSWWESLLHNYLFFRVPLIQPDWLLDWTYPRLRPFLSRRFFMATMLVGLFSLLLVVRQWDIFWATFLGFLSWEGAAAFGISLAVVKILHEAGHALACRHFGLRVPSVGVAFIVMWPVMYTDASEAWRLQSRHARLLIASAGMLVELSIACYATLAWVMLPDGLLRSVMFTLATTTWVMSLAVNLNPLMRFDGYFIFSDFFNIPNLQERGFFLARNRLRHVVFGVPLAGDPGMSAKAQRIAIIWAYATWIYRFFLFLGIAFLVYHFFFKALGIFLFLVEIWWFVVGPIWREVRNWRELTPVMGVRRRYWWLAVGFVALLLLLVPWHGSFRVPALMQAEEIQRLYPAEPAKILAIAVRNGSQVVAGDVLMQLSSPELDASIAAAVAETRRAEYDLNRVLSSSVSASDRLVAEEALERGRASLRNLELQRQRLTVSASFDGEVRDIPPSVRPGLWVGGKQLLGVLAGTTKPAVVDAYVPEEYLRFVRQGDSAHFYPEDVTVPVQEGRIIEIDAVDTAVLNDPYLAGTFGGGISVRTTRDGAIPEQAVYRVRIRLEAEQHLDRRLRGWARLDGDSRSLLQRAGSFLAGVLLRESGF
ncbi:MAG: HlyD family efflux transporter periplasmic adaptor subunit [Pedobacter sp.]|nr:HlyD family efflux transporter periplasmic adaptor subunit [Pedobacter sp.]